jgi:ParB/RepB/Spo0J family partition protein
MLFSLTDIPQADRLDKVILTVKSISEGANTDVRIAAAIGFSDRQGRYYRHAAEILGFVKNERNNAIATDSGFNLVQAESDKKLIIVRKAIYENNFFKEIIRFVNLQGEAVSEEAIKNFVLSITDTKIHTTVPRRVKTIISWLLYLDIIIEAEENYQINSKTYNDVVEDNKIDDTNNFLADYVYGSDNKTLQQIPVENISPNPHNPRLIFDPKDLEELKGSIAKVKILVPLTVYRNTKNYPKTEYVLLDGERRWRCAKELGFETVPANIIDEPKDVTQNILFMFNIHHFRKEWALFPTALKLEVLVDQLETDNESVLSGFTGVPKQTIRRCKALLWYPRKYREVLSEKSGKISTDFFIELFPIANRLSYEDEFSFPLGTEKFIDACIAKFTEQKHIHDVKEFREMRKSMGYFDKTSNFPEFIKSVATFINSDVGLEIFASADIEEEQTRKNIIKYVAYLNASLENINVDVISDFSIEEQLKSLRDKLQQILETID